MHTEYNRLESFDSWLYLLNYYAENVKFHRKWHNDALKHGMKFRLKCWDFLFGEPCCSMQYQHKSDIMISAPQKVSHEHLILGTYIDVAHNHLLYTYGIDDGEATFVPSGCRKKAHQNVKFICHFFLLSDDQLLVIKSHCDKFHSFVT